MLVPKTKINLPANARCNYSTSEKIFFGLTDGSFMIVDVNTMNATTIKAHSELIKGISVKGQIVATTSIDDTIKLWDVSSLKSLQTLKGHKNTVNSCSFSPNGSVLISVSRDKTVKVWDVSSGECIRTLTGHTYFVETCDFAPNGTHFVSGSNDRTLRVWDSQTFQCIAILKGHTDIIKGCKYSPDSNFIVSASNDCSVKVWDIQSFGCIATLQHNKSVYTCCWDLSGKYIVSTSADMTLTIWESKSWKSLDSVQTLIPIEYSTLSPNGKLYIGGSFDSLDCQIWEFNPPQRGENSLNSTENVILSLQKELKEMQLKYQHLQEEYKFEVGALKQQINSLQNKLEEKSKNSVNNEVYLLDFAHFEVLKDKVLGKGAFGKVYQGIYYKLPVAVKKLKTSHSAQAMQDFKNEIQLLMKLKHANVVACFGCVMNESPLAVMEYMSQGSLYSWLSLQQRPIDQDLINRLLNDISLGMHYLHSQKPIIIHRDLKSLNILLDHSLNAKISDFGLSKTKAHSQMNTSVSTIGTIPWAAPEYLTIKRLNERNEKGDVFSFGVIIWELVTRQVPWKAENISAEDVKEATLSGIRLDIPENCPEYLQTLMEKCWCDNPQERPTFGEIIDTLKEHKEEGLSLEEQEELDRLKKKLKEQKKNFGY